MPLFNSLVTLTSLSLSLLPGPTAVLAETDSNLNASKHRYESHTATGDLVCRPFGDCEPCPIDEVSVAGFSFSAPEYRGLK